MEDVRVGSWGELTEALFAGSWQEPLQRHRLSCAFRGQSDLDQTLVTSLARMGEESWRVEGAMLRAFRKYARFQTRGYDTVWDWLAVAQHHGLPTRLLDWTYSPLVAVHFATAEHPDCDGVVWRVDFAKTNALLPKKLRALLEEEGADVFTAELLHQAAPTLSDFQKSARKEFLLFLEPPSLDARITNQFALFSLMSDARTQLDRWLAKNPASFRRVVIPARLKGEVRDMLDQSNINERVLFPGMDGLSAYLKRYYTPAGANPAALPVLKTVRKPREPLPHKRRSGTEPPPMRPRGGSR